MTTGHSRTLIAALLSSAACTMPAQAAAQAAAQAPTAANGRVPTAASVQPAASYAFDMPAQDMGDALRQVAARAGLELYASAADLERLAAPALQGHLDVRAAIAALLRGSGLGADFDGGSIVIRRLSWVAASSSSSAAAAAADSRAEPPEPIVVTGTNIRGASVTSPVITVGRDDIEKAGQNDLGEVARSIPQNFSGGQNPGVGNGAGLINTNLNSASQLNLRGLGPDATLTLLNGHRLPYDGAFGGVDISAIPVAAVERLEIVPDGASAQYGSDAVAGVANIILRRDFTGLTTSARIGAATSGGNFQQGADAVGGANWGSGSIMLAYQFAKNSAIFGSERDFAASLPAGNSIYPRIRQHSLIASGHQEIAEGIEFSVDALYSRRRSRTVGGNAGTAGITRSIFAPSAESFSIAPEVGIALGGSWKARASIAYGRDRTRYNTLITPPGRVGVLTSGCYCNSALSAELVFDGPVLSLPAGDIRAAFGGGYRSNSMAYSQRQNDVLVGAFDVSRDSHFLFGEAEFPIVAPHQDRALLRRLTVTAAARYENYPGMGKVTTPKIGFIYEPGAALTFKASWGRSFKAPTLYQQYVGYETYLLNAADYAAAPSGTIIYTSGGNPDLKPERASSWSIGGELHPPAIAGLRVNASYFSVRYRDRVAQPIAGSIATAFSNPGYASLLIRNPGAAQLDALIAGALYGLTNFADEDYDPAAVAVLVDNRNRNVARQAIEGVDFAIRYALDLGSGQRLDLGGSATYLKSDQLITAELPRTQLAGMLFNPPHWRGRVGATFEGEGHMISAFANYIGEVEDRRFTLVSDVKSIVTVDLAARMDVGSRGDVEPLFDLSLVVNNLFNASPARIRTRGSSDTPYDSTNFSPIGRFIGLKIARSW